MFCFSERSLFCFACTEPWSWDACDLGSAPRGPKSYLPDRRTTWCRCHVMWSCCVISLYFTIRLILLMIFFIIFCFVWYSETMDMCFCFLLDFCSPPLPVYDYIHSLYISVHLYTSHHIMSRVCLVTQVFWLGNSGHQTRLFRIIKRKQKDQADEATRCYGRCLECWSVAGWYIMIRASKPCRSSNKAKNHWTAGDNHLSAFKHSTLGPWRSPPALHLLRSSPNSLGRCDLTFSLALISDYTRTE